MLGDTACTRLVTGRRGASGRCGAKNATPQAASFMLGIALTGLAVGIASPAQADQVAYLVNVTVRPGYNFANAQDALSYGGGICNKIASGRSYESIMGDVQNDFSSADAYQASYLISQSANELCPALIWQLRNAASGFRPEP